MIISEHIRKQIEPSLNEHQDPLWTFFNASPNAMAVLNILYKEEGGVEDFEIVELNNAALLNLKIKKEEVIGKTYSLLFPNISLTELMDLLKQVTLDGRARETELSYDEKGAIHWWCIRATKSGKLLVTTAEDITMRKQAEIHLQQSSERLEAAFNISTNAMYVIKAVRNETGKVTDFMYEWLNREAIKIAGRDLSGEGVIEKPHILGNEGLFRLFSKTIDDGKPLDFEAQHLINGISIWFHWKAVKFNDGLFVSIENTTEKKNAEKELLDLKLKQQRDILNAIILTQEQERQRIGEALHDGVAQLLYGIQTRLQLLKTELPEDLKNLKSIDAILKETIIDTRNISFELVPAVLKDHGIEVALKALFQRIIADKPCIDLRLSGLADRLPEKIEFAVYRIVQELVNNILKHARATETLIRISLKTKRLSLIVSDNGIGFNQKETKAMHKGIGLQSVRNRVKLLEGSFKVRSGPEGTNIIITLPII